MKETFLEKIYAAKRIRVDNEKRRIGMEEVKAGAFDARNGAARFRFSEALANDSRINIIAEIKRASPSKGIINSEIDVAEVAAAYENGGAFAMSVLTEEDFFRGSLDDLRSARAASSLPILRKDFIFDEFQIYEAAAAGADAILLIVAMLNRQQLRDLRDLAENELGLDALIEVHTADEMRRVSEISPTLIGVNNRDLRSFDVSLDVSRRLIEDRPTGALMITESGLSTPDEILELRSLGYSGFLIGETLMKSGNIKLDLGKLTATVESV